MLISSYSFASTEVVQAEEVFDGSVSTGLSCDIDVTVSWEGDSISDEEGFDIAVDIILFLEDFLC